MRSAVLARPFARSRPLRRHGRALLVATGCALAGGGARAAESGVAPGSSADFLTWHAPPGCGQAAAIRARVSELLGQRELDLDRVQRVEGRVRPTRDGWVLELQLFGAFGTRQRELTSRRCDDLPEAAAVAITLAFEAAGSPAGAIPDADGGRAGAAADAGASASEVPASAETARAETARAEAAPVAPAVLDEPPSSAGSEARTLPRWALGAELNVDASALPEAAAGGSLIALARWDELRVGVFALWLPGVGQTVGPGQRVDFSLLVAGVRACYALGRGLVDTAVCAGFEAGQLSARGAGLAEARDVHDPWLAPELGLELSAEPAARLTLQLHAEAVAPLLRQGYAVNATEDIHHVASLGVRGGVGFVVAF